MSVSPTNIFLSMLSISYQRKAGHQFFSELLAYVTWSPCSLSACVSPPINLRLMRGMRSPCCLCLCVAVIVARQRAVCSLFNFFPFSTRSVSYKRKIDDYFFPELTLTSWQLYTVKCITEWGHGLTSVSNREFGNQRIYMFQVFEYM
jgi:hypothetical protein